MFEYASHFKRYPMGMYVFKVRADILLRSNGEMIYYYQVDSLPTENIMGEGGCEWYEYILWYMMKDAVVLIWL